MYKVLLVDDEILVRHAIRENMHWNELGCELVNDCENGKQAKEYIETHAVDIVLTDICMPYMDGMELSRYLYENYPEVAIIIFSGFEEFEYAKKAIKYRVAEYILKPVTARELSDVLTRVKEKLDEKRKEEEKINVLSKGYDTYKKNKSLILSKALSRLVLGTQDTKETLKELENMGITFQSAYYRVVIIGIDLYADFFEIDRNVKQQSVLMAFAVENICNEIIHDYGLGMAFQDKDNQVCLLIQTNKKQEAMGTAKEMCEKIQKSVAALMNFTVSCGLGTYVKEISDLSESYKNATEVLNYWYLLGNQMVLDMEEKKGELNKDIELESKLEELSQAVRAGESKAVEAVLDNIAVEIKQSYIGKNRTCMYLQQTIRTIYDVLREVKQEEDIDTGKKEEVLQRIANSNTFLEMQGEVQEYATLVLKLLADMKCSSRRRQASQALEYIKKNYADPELSLNSVCSYLNVSTSHFSTIFKEATGSTFMEVVIGIRMEKAKELLSKTTLKNYEIAERVGFSDPHYFSVCFKKVTGKTPKTYAKGK